MLPNCKDSPREHTERVLRAPISLCDINIFDGKAQISLQRIRIVANVGAGWGKVLEKLEEMFINPEMIELVQDLVIYGMGG